MREAIRVNPKDAPEVVAIGRRAFPGYRGRTYKVVPFAGPMTIRSCWSGGSRDDYAFASLSDGKRLAVGECGSGFGAPAGRLEQLPRGVVLVEHSTFCGRDHGLTLYVRPDDLNQSALVPPAEDLTPFERVVLVYTRCRKSSYNGRNREAQALDDCESHESYGYGGECEFPTPAANRWASLEGRREFSDRWQAARSRLIGRKLLNRAGAITPAGRNAAVK